MKWVNPKRNRLALAIALSLTLVGCEYIPVPVETVRPVSRQLDMQAVHHWDRLAERVAENIRENLPNQATLEVVANFPQVEEPLVPVATVENNPLSNLPPGTLPPPGPQPGNTLSEEAATVAVSAPATPDQPRVIELDLSSPDLGLSPEEAQRHNFSAASASAQAAIIPVSNPTLGPDFSAGEVSNRSSRPLPSPRRPILYINPPRGGFETTFGHSFHKLLRTHLTQKGVAVTTNPDSVSTYCTRGRFCKPMILDYNVELVQHKDRWHVPEPDDEVLINTAVTDGDLVVFSRSDMYYINAGDGDHYRRGTKTLRVVD